MHTRKQLYKVAVKFGTLGSNSKQHDQTLVGALAAAALRTGRRVDIYARSGKGAQYRIVAYTTGNDPQNYKLMLSPGSGYGYNFYVGNKTVRILTLVQKFQRLLEEFDKQRIEIKIDDFK